MFKRASLSLPAATSSVVEPTNPLFVSRLCSQTTSTTQQHQTQ